MKPESDVTVLSLKPPFHKIWPFGTGWFKSLPSKNVPARSLIRWGADFAIASKCKHLSISVYGKTSGCKLGRLTSQSHNPLWFSCNSWRVHHLGRQHLQPAQVNPAQVNLHQHRWISLNCPCFLNYPAINAQRITREKLQSFAFCSRDLSL